MTQMSSGMNLYPWHLYPLGLGATKINHAGGQLCLSFLFSSETYSLEWCHQHSGVVCHPKLILSEKATTDISQSVSL